MTVYVAVDFHAREQTISWCDTADGEVHRTKLRHQHDDVRKFYEQFSGEVIVAFERRSLVRMQIGCVAQTNF